jgi:hypothetical protein
MMNAPGCEVICRLKFLMQSCPTKNFYLRFGFCFLELSNMKGRMRAIELDLVC